MGLVLYFMDRMAYLSGVQSDAVPGPSTCYRWQDINLILIHEIISDHYRVVSYRWGRLGGDITLEVTGVGFPDN